jgi:chromosome partitioning protein
MNKIISVSTQKGGVLKSSIVSNLAGLLATSGKKVLIIDTDAQANIALSFGLNPDSFNTTLYDVLIDRIPPEYAIQNVYKDIDLLSSGEDMTFFEFDVLTNIKKYPQPFRIMKETLSSLYNKYDIILVDTPPNLGLVQGNVLSYAESVLIPFQPEGYSMRSLVKILDAIHNFRDQHNPNLEVLGVVGTLVDSRTTLHSQVLQQCRAYCIENGIRMFETVIPRSVRFAASVAYDRKPATLSDPKHPLVQSYSGLLQELQEVQ